MSTSTYIVIITMLLICSAYFSALNRTKIKALAEKGDKKAKVVCTAKDDENKKDKTNDKND
ncbi:MAG: hypothetical protein SPL89_03735 [Clostridia bacterium]|nr:hypothetical protein [Clostridia bacterium]